MKFFADFNIHSKYSRGTHPDMEIPTLARVAKAKGLSLLGTGDFTQPQWLVELKKFLKPATGRGIYEYGDMKFCLTSELVCVFPRNGRTLKINHLIFAPHFQTADKLIDALERFGNLETEGRPLVRLSAEELVKITRDVSPECLVVPAHAWGLHHSLFSPSFGFDRLEEAYGAQAGSVRVLETGHCADPALARRWPGVSERTLISNSDAHHPAHLGRECNLFDGAIDYKDILTALEKNDRARFLGTVEMFPAEDRYFASGHKACQKWASPPGSSGVCPACGKPFSPGVAERVAKNAVAGGLAEDRVWRVVPLQDIIAEALGFQTGADAVQRMHAAITGQFGPELDILVHWTPEELRERLPRPVAEGVMALRQGDVVLSPGYDGLPGRVQVRIPAGLPSDMGQLKPFH